MVTTMSGKLSSLGIPHPPGNDYPQHNAKTKCGGVFVFVFFLRGVREGVLLIRKILQDLNILQHHNFPRFKVLKFHTSQGLGYLSAGLSYISMSNQPGKP